MKHFYIILIITIGLTSCMRSQIDNQRPNILFCIWDDASAHMSAYGYDWCKTPSFDEIAKRGILFSNAYTPNAKCAPSRSSVLTGRNSWQLEEAANHVVNFPAKLGATITDVKDFKE